SLIVLSTRRTLPDHVNLRWIASGALLTLSALVKYATLPIGVIGAMVWAGEMHSWRTRVLWLSVAAGVFAGLVGIGFLPWYQGLATLSPAFDEVNGMYYHRSLSGVVERLVVGRIPGADPDVAQLTVRMGSRVLTIVGFGIYFLWELYSIATRRRDEV